MVLRFQICRGTPSRGRVSSGLLISDVDSRVLSRARAHRVYDFYVSSHNTNTPWPQTRLLSHPDVVRGFFSLVYNLQSLLTCLLLIRRWIRPILLNWIVHIPI